MNNRPLACHLNSGEILYGQLLEIDSQKRQVQFMPSSSNTQHTIPMDEMSHFYYYKPYPAGRNFPFRIIFSNGTTLQAEAQHHQTDETGDHLYNITAEKPPLHLCLPRESAHQLILSTDNPDIEPNNEQLEASQQVVDLIDEAITARASDIHMRPMQQYVEVRYRIDGVLEPNKKLSLHHYPAIVSRIKILGNMDIAEQRHPQGGAHHFSYQGRKVDLRISSMPVLEGESIVIRILDPQSGLRALSDIGFLSRDEACFREMLQQKSGLILVTGPTGSGKSTTLYAAMRELRQRDVNIISLEDPVEYQLDRIRQIEINEAAGSTFANNLRHVLRHDPDVILIGEIRDHETARIALQSAYTGHLVLSTLHTGDAPSAIPRLLDMGVEPYTLKDTLLGVLSQRLIRKSCTQCHGASELVSHCNHCNQSGYHGRIPLYELMQVSSEMMSHVHDGITAEEVRQLAVTEGMVPMTQYGAALLEQQATTQQELKIDEPE
ncbi:MAG: type II/IV secretion system protein [Gammaproteobacteria bacterium]|nr:type II/IV secretion system protein [Gammaproteobacteria bacterium]MBT3490189.1 type II/IV secretion system protein [Gammaproteobacteria bacterium]MBT3718748.1 type II/IV secretion system protein [Gammaproteobacteria bacterium]MBT3845759.1 type II/IV secretion system protein [Gammaproteobacteria bacterium]MBT3892041.1 type II/IV secretion system protein [Gammaproteobacteria bacterium]